MKYTAAGARKTLAVVGKGSHSIPAAISIKPADNMEYMRHDKTGACTVIGFVQLAAAAKLPVNVVGIFAATENLPSGTAYKPGDVFKAYNGKTMEIVNTMPKDVSFSRFTGVRRGAQPDAIIDFATLTGACQVALAIMPPA